MTVVVTAVRTRPFPTHAYTLPVVRELPVPAPLAGGGW